MGDAVRIAIADDSAVIRSLIEEIIRYQPEYDLVAAFDNGRDIVSWVREGGHADVFVIDMRLPGLSGTATIAALRRYQKEAKILAFSASAQEESVHAAMAAGASGYLIKEASLSELLDAISPSGPAPAAVDVARDRQVEGDPSRRGVGGPGAGLCVLVIDDHELVRDATEAMLQSKGFSVHSTSTAEEARDWLGENHRCDAVLLDLRLGEESGAGMVEEIHALRPECAVMLHSGAADRDGDRIARETGADGFLAKGDYTIEQVTTAISTAIERRRAQFGTDAGAGA